MRAEEHDEKINKLFYNFKDGFSSKLFMLLRGSKKIVSDASEHIKGTMLKVFVPISLTQSLSFHCLSLKTFLVLLSNVH